MTAEIGILNRQGIALAADSAVTCGYEDKNKILNSANKLFNLIKGKPIGIMIYGSGDFMGLPWEIVIGEYRKYVCNSNINFNTLEEYAKNFKDFLNGNKNLYSKDISNNIMFRELSDAITYISSLATDKINKLFLDRSPTANETDKIFLETLENVLEKFKSIDFLEGFDLSDIEKIKKESDIIVNIIKNRLVVNIDEKNTEKLKELTGLTLCKDIWNNYTGVVIAGYGDNDLLPKLEEFYIAGMVNNKLRYKLNRSSRIYQEEGENKPTAEIMPFAQQEMIHSILTGIEPTLENFIFEKINDTYYNIKEYINCYYDKINISSTQKEIAQSLDEEDICFIEDIKHENDELETFLQKQINYIKNELQKNQFTNFINPVLDMVAMLQKEELAVMAETLVNITSFKRKFTFDDETVGGPIDVAIISKSDGFIWIKRKHYFDKELNHTYFKL